MTRFHPHRICGGNPRVHISPYTRLAKGSEGCHHGRWADYRGRTPHDSRSADSHVARTREGQGEVWYYREVPEADPHPNAMKVLEAIVDQNLPIRLSTKPDYSDSVDDKGRSIPGR